MGLFDLVFRTCSLDFRFSWESWLVKRHGHENEDRLVSIIRGRV